MIPTSPLAHLQGLCSSLRYVSIHLIITTTATFEISEYYVTR